MILQKLCASSWHFTSCNHNLLSISQQRFSAGGRLYIHMCPVNVMASGEKLRLSLEQRIEKNSEEVINSDLVGHLLSLTWKQPLIFLCVHSLYRVWEYISPVYCLIHRLAAFSSLTEVSEILWKTWLSCLWWNMLVSKKICCYYCSIKEAWIPDDGCKLH